MVVILLYVTKACFLLRILRGLKCLLMFLIFWSINGKLEYGYLLGQKLKEFNIKQINFPDPFIKKNLIVSNTMLEARTYLKFDL